MTLKTYIHTRLLNDFLSILLAAALTAICICCPNVSKGQYHIQVRCYTKADNKDEQAYFIKFTNDNWKTEASLHDVYDDSEIFPPCTIRYTDLIFLEGDLAKEKAIEFARRFKSYTTCLLYNKNIWDKRNKLLKYRQSHPNIVAVLKPKKQACCKIIKVY